MIVPVRTERSHANLTSLADALVTDAKARLAQLANEVREGDHTPEQLAAYLGLCTRVESEVHDALSMLRAAIQEASR